MQVYRYVIYIPMYVYANLCMIFIHGHICWCKTYVYRIWTYKTKQFEYLQMSTNRCICILTCTCTHAHTCAHTCTFTHTHVRTIYAKLYTSDLCQNIPTHVYVYMYIYIYTYKRTHVYSIYVWMCAFAYVCLCGCAWVGVCVSVCVYAHQIDRRSTPLEAKSLINLGI